MAYAPQLDVALALGLQLSLEDRLRLIEGLVSSVARELGDKPVSEKPYSGKDVFSLLDDLDLSEWETVGIHDPVKWVKLLRRKEQ